MGRKGKSEYTDEEKRLSQELWDKGMTAGMIAREIGRDPKTVRAHLAEYNADRVAVGKYRSQSKTTLKEKLSPHLAEIFGRYQDGESIEDMAEEYKASASYILELLKRADYPLPEQGWHTRKYATPHEFIDAWQNSATIGQVVERLNPMPRTAIYSRAWIYRRRGIPLKRLISPRRDWDELRKFAELFLEE